jgi:hypothetical protein
VTSTEYLNILRNKAITKKSEKKTKGQVIKKCNKSSNSKNYSETCSAQFAVMWIPIAIREAGGRFQSKFQTCL